MTEPAFPTKADRCSLIALRANTLRPLIISHMTGDDGVIDSLISYIDDLVTNCGSMSFPACPISRRMFDDGVRIKEESAREIWERISDLEDILLAESWPLPWYTIESHELNASDRDQITALVDAYATALIRRDKDAAIMLYVSEGRFLESKELEINKYITASTLEVQRNKDYPILPRFDGRTVVIGTLQSTTPITLIYADKTVIKTRPLDLMAARIQKDWRLY